jgi:hypothetical protein
MQPQALARGVRPAGRSPRGARLQERPARMAQIVVDESALAQHSAVEGSQQAARAVL